MSYTPPEHAPTPLVEMASDPWRYTVYEGDGRVFLSVLCGTHALYLVNIELNAEELADYAQNGVATLKELAATIGSSPKEYTSRHIPKLLSWPRRSSKPDD